MPTTSPARCPRCGHEHAPRPLCPSCGAIRSLPSDTDYFTVLGLPCHPVLDEAALSATYYALSRGLHPDLHETGTPEEQRASLTNTALLNRAYRTLRDPVSRGRYWLGMHGEALGKDNNRVPAKLAALVFDVQEKLAEARAAHSADGTDAPAELEAVRGALDVQVRGLRGELEANFSRWEEGTESPALLSELKRVLSELAYLGTLTRDVEKEVNQPWNA